MKLRPDAKLCQIGRCYDPNHPTCRTCQLGCALKAANKGANLACEPTLSPPEGKGKGKQTKTEIEAGNMLKMEFPNCNIAAWGFRITMLNGHAYTPDFLVWPVDGCYLAVEVKQRGKDGFRQNSYQRAKLAFDQCRTEHPLIKFRWMEKHKGEWTIKDYQ